MSASPPNSKECPHCGQRMLIRHGVRLSPRLADIFDIIEHSGERGVTEEVLASIFYSGRSAREAYNCVRVNVSHINNHLLSTDYRVAKADGVRGAEYPYRVLKEDQAGEVRSGGGPVRELPEQAATGKDPV